MINRRNFLRNSGALALGSLVVPSQMASLLNGKGMQPVGVQLFTTMSIIDKDVEGTLKQIAAIGYKEIESAFSMKGGFYGMKPKEFAALLKNLGLSWESHHVVGAPFQRPTPPPIPAGTTPPPPPPNPMAKMPPMKNLRDNFQEVVDDVAEGGVKYLVCASIPLKTSDNIKEAIEVLTKTGEACKKAGVTLAYHNHTAEFEKVGDQIPFDALASQISPDLLKFELDLAWATKAGMNPVDLFKKHPGRFPLWHIKDLNKETQKPVEVGSGYIDFKPIFAEAKIAGMKHIFVEQDGAPSPIDNLSTSFKNIEKILA